jgi:hypothetical protein
MPTMVKCTRRVKISCMRVIFGIIISLFVYNVLYCYVTKALTSEVIPRLNELKIYTYGISPSLVYDNDLIVIMTPKVSHKLIDRLKLLDSNLADNYSTAVLIMHSDYSHQDDLRRLVDATKRQMLFLNIDTIFTLFPLGFDSCGTRSTWRVRGKWNYQLMIRFWFKILFELPQLQKYEYIMRLDDDSKITGKWINVFDEMRSKNAVYFANNLDMDEERQLPGTMKLKRVTLEYQKQTNIMIKQPEMLRNAFGDNFIRSYFNNFEVLKLEFFRRQNVRHWIETVDQTFGIFKYRWGDAILRYITIALFAEQHKVLHRSQYNLSYCHKC